MIKALSPGLRERQPPGELGGLGCDRSQASRNSLVISTRLTSAEPVTRASCSRVPSSCWRKIRFLVPILVVMVGSDGAWDFM